MKEFEKVAIAKGLAKAEVISSNKSDNVKLEPSENLMIDMLNLAEGLRSKGFIKDAQSLEEKVLAFKSAETHLYRAVDEDAEDMLEFAHPKKNRVKFEAKDGHGDFEDTRTQHEKMISIVNKKVAEEYNEVLEKTAEILGLKKNSDLDVIGEKITNITYFKNKINELLNQKPAFYFATRASFLSGSDDVLYIGSNKLGVGFPLIEGNAAYNNDQFSHDALNLFKKINSITETIWKSFLDKDSSFDEIVSDENINRANSKIQEMYAEFLNKLHSLPLIEKQGDGSVKDDILNQYTETLNYLLSPANIFIFESLTTNDDKLENKVRDFVSSLIANVKDLKPYTAKTGMSEILDSGWANLIASRFESVAAIKDAPDSDPNYFTTVANIIKSNANKPYEVTYKALIAFDKDLTQATDKSKLDLWAQEWQKHFQKKASKINNIIKEAKIPGASVVPQAPTSPAKYSRPVSHVNHSVIHKSTFQQANPEEYDAVSKMQTAIHALADSLSELFPKEQANVLANWVSDLTSTGYGEKGPKAEPIDGEWGPATEKSLKVAQSILSKLGYKETLTTDAQRINGQAKNSKEDIINLATANLNQIQKALIDHNIDFKGKVQAVKIEEDSPYIDSLPENINFAGPVLTEENLKSGLNLTKDNLSSFNNLFNFLKIHGLVEANGLNIKDWERNIRWLYNRASKQLIDTKKKSKAEYKILLEHLFSKLQDYAATHEASDAIIPSKQLDGNVTSTVSQKPSGPTIPASNDSNSEGVDEQTNSVEKILPAPFGYKFDLTNLHEQYGTVMNAYDQYAYLLNDVTFDVNDFGYDVTAIATTYIKLTIDKILQLNRLNPNDFVPNLKIKGQPVTYTQLFSYFGNVPYVIDIKAKAYDYALYQVCSGLLNDLSNVMAYWKRNTKHAQQSSELLDAAWKKWSESLRRTLGRINQDLAQNGPSPSLQGSY